MAGPVFTFRFQRILEARERKQQALEMELGRLDRAMLEGHLELERWQAARRATLEEMRRARLEADLDRNARSAEYLRHVGERTARCRCALADLACDRADVMRRLEHAMRSRKALDEYRDRLEREFLAEQERSQERIVDLHSLRKFMQAEGVS